MWRLFSLVERLWLVRYAADAKDESESERSERMDTSALTVPSRDDAYDFTLTAYCSRSVGGRRRFGSWGYEEDEVRRLHETVREAARSVTRNFWIFEVGAAERAVNRELAARLRREHEGTPGAPLWVVRAELAPPDEVRALMREATRRRYAIQAKAEADALHLEKTNELRLRWGGFLGETAADPIARHAVRLSEDPTDIATALTSIQDERREGAEQLMSQIARIVEAQQSADLLDLVISSESVLRKTLQLVGIEVPDVDPETTLVPFDEG